MATKDHPINPAIPPDTGRSPRLGAEDIREFKDGTIELFSKDHYVGSDGGSGYNEDAAGEHAKVTLRETTKPTNAADKGFVYTKDVGGTTELFYEDAAGNEKQLTSAGKLNVVDADGAVVKTGAQTIAGVKTFSDKPIVPTPSGATDAANKGYVDTVITTKMPSGGNFGTWESKSNNTVYQAVTDGFVIAQVAGSADMRILTDSNNPPTTVRRRSYDNANVHDIICPIKKNDYWKVVEATTVYWLPFGS